MIAAAQSLSAPGLGTATRCPACGGGRGACACDRRAGGAAAAAMDAQPPEQSARLRDLQKADAEVRAHEQAHVAAGGRYVAGGARYQTETGPDNRQYAVSGEVSIDTAPIPGNPDATLEKARTVRRAALAPAEPSGQDMQVAAQASQLEIQARMDKTQPQSRADENGYALSAEGFADDMEHGTASTPPRHAVQAYANAGTPQPRNRGEFSALA